MTIIEQLDAVRALAKEDVSLRMRLLATREEVGAIDKFCAIVHTLGYDIDPVALIFAGEDSYAAMRRATNGGGENSPMLEGEDDYYDLLMCDLACMK